MLIAAFYITWFSVLAAPAAGVLLVLRWQAREGTDLRRGLAWAAAYLGMVGLCVATGLQWSWPFLNFLSCLAALYAYWIAAAGALAIPTRWLRIPASVLAALPLLPSLFLGTIGALALIFVLGDVLDPPIETRRLSSTRLCETTTWGAAFGPSGYTVSMYWSPVWIPILRYTLASDSVDETSPAPGHESATCDSVAASL